MKDSNGKIDVKSFITIALVVSLIVITLALVAAVIFGILPTDNPLVNAIIVLFSNSTTMVMTYFFVKKKEQEETKGGELNE